MVKKRGLVWTYYNKKVEGTTVVAFCKFCNRSYIQNATRMEKHLARCEKAAPDVKQLFLRVSTSKRVNRARLLGAKIGGSWIKNGDVTLDISSLTEADLDDINEWNRQKEDATNDDEPVQSLDLICEEEEHGEAWPEQQDSVKSSARSSSNDKRINNTNKEWMHKENDHDTITVGLFDDTEEPRQRSLSDSMNKSDNNSFLPQTHSNSTPTHTSLQTKVLQEQLAERRALRKIAELDLRRKTIEFERYQYEYERDKTRADIRWAHESRMMQLREERERKFIQESSSIISK